MVEKEFEWEYNLASIIYIFILCFICNVLANMDHGSLPACTEEIM
jgi:hypothetical protein